MPGTVQGVGSRGESRGPGPCCPEACSVTCRGAGGQARTSGVNSIRP